MRRAARGVIGIIIQRNVRLRLKPLIKSTFGAIAEVHIHGSAEEPPREFDNLPVGRRTSIIRIEEKRDGRSYTGPPDPRLYRQAEERALASAIVVAKKDARAAVERED